MLVHSRQGKSVVRSIFRHVAFWGEIRVAWHREALLGPCFGTGAGGCACICCPTFVCCGRRGGGYPPTVVVGGGYQSQGLVGVSPSLLRPSTRWFTSNIPARCSSLDLVRVGDR